MKNLLQKITGFSPMVISLLEIADQNKITIMGGILLFTSLVSAIMISIAFAVMSFHNPYLVPVIFLLWFTFVYFFERIIISGRKVNTMVMITRFLAAIAFALIHSLIIDILFFQTDIRESFMNQNKLIATRISKDYGAKISSKTKMINELVAQNQLLSNKIIHLRNQIVSEGDGSSGTHKVGMGPIFNMKKKMLLPEIKALNKNISNNKISIEEYKEEIKAIKTKEDHNINKIIPPNQHGLLSNLRQLNQVEFVHGDFVSRLFASLFLIIFIVIETLPLITKLSLDITNYYNISEMARKEKEDVGFIYIEQIKITEGNQIILTSKIDDLNFQTKITHKKLAILKESVHERFKKSQEILELIQFEKENLIRQYPEYAESHINPLIRTVEKDVSQFIKQLNINLS